MYSSYSKKICNVITVPCMKAHGKLKYLDKWAGPVPGSHYYLFIELMGFMDKRELVGACYYMICYCVLSCIIGNFQVVSTIISLSSQFGHVQVETYIRQSLPLLRNQSL